MDLDHEADLKSNPCKNPHIYIIVNFGSPRRLFPGLLPLPSTTPSSTLGIILNLIQVLENIPLLAFVPIICTVTRYIKAQYRA